MSKIGLYTPDATDFPNFALAKLKRYFSNGELWTPGVDYDMVFTSSVFTFSDHGGIPPDSIVGGSGINILTKLPSAIEELEPDYSLYPDIPFAFGFLTRGCIRHCDFCIVHDKEGLIHPYRDIETVAQGRTDVVLMDNNVLASPHGLHQLERIADLHLRVDFNQGLDARLITDDTAKLLKRVKWLKAVRLSCDSDSQIEPVKKAVELLRWNNVTPRRYFVYVLAKDVESTLPRLKFLKGMDVDPFVQPYRDTLNTPPSRELRRLARWVDAGGGRAFRSCSWEDWCKFRGDKI